MNSFCVLASFQVRKEFLHAEGRICVRLRSVGPILTRALQQEKRVHTVEREIEELSDNDAGGVQLRAFIRPGCGFTKWGGMKVSV